MTNCMTLRPIRVSFGSQPVGNDPIGSLSGAAYGVSVSSLLEIAALSVLILSMKMWNKKPTIRWARQNARRLIRKFCIVGRAV